MGVVISSCKGERGAGKSKYLTSEEEEETKKLNIGDCTKLARATAPARSDEFPSREKGVVSPPPQVRPPSDKSNSIKQQQLSYKQAVLAGGVNNSREVSKPKSSHPTDIPSDHNQHQQRRHDDNKVNKSHYLNYLKQHHSNILHHDHHSRFNHSRQLGGAHSATSHSVCLIPREASGRGGGQINLKIQVTTNSLDVNDDCFDDQDQEEKNNVVLGQRVELHSPSQLLSSRRKKNLLTRSSNLYQKSSVSNQNTVESLSSSSAKSRKSGDSKKKKHQSSSTSTVRRRRSQSCSSTTTPTEVEGFEESDDLFEKSMSQVNERRHQQQRPNSSREHVSSINKNKHHHQRKHSAAATTATTATTNPTGGGGIGRSSSRSESIQNQQQQQQQSNTASSNRSSSNNTSHYYHHHHHHHHIHHLHHAARVKLLNGGTTVAASAAAAATATTTHRHHRHRQQTNTGHSNIDNSRENSPTMSITSLVNGEMIRNGASIFSHLYSQISNNACKVVTDDSAASLVSFSTNNSQKGSPRDKNKYDDSASTNCQPVSHYTDLSSFDTLPAVESIDSVKCSITRLIKIKNALDEPSDLFSFITKHDLKKNLDYVLRVLENVLLDERKRLMSEDDVLSEVEPDTVPNEVRNWLSMTFTRSVSNMKRKMEDKPKFKSVAQAIRAGIMVDRMLRRMSSSLESNVPPPVSRVLKTLNEWNFEVFEMNTCSDNQALRYLGFELMQKFNLLSKFKIQNLVMQNFLEAMEAGYSKYNNPYHNLIHSTDVLQTTYHMLNSAGLMTWLTPLEILATFVSAIIHDYEHTGTTNNFHMQTRSELALTYNDRAVLENYHISATFRLLTNDTYNIVQELTREEYKEFRQLVIEMVLATDMSYHFTQLKTIKNMISLNETIEKPKALSLILHCADISHPSKKWSLHETWTNLLVDEYFAQGDKEKELGLPFSPLCDRNNTPLAQSQIGFISFIVEPSMTVLGDMIDRIFDQILSEEASRASKSDLNDSISSQDSLKKKPIDRPWVGHLAENKAKWQSLAEVEKQKAAAAAAAAAAIAAAGVQESIDSLESIEIPNTKNRSEETTTTSSPPSKSE